MALLKISKWYKWGLYSQGDGTKLIRRYRLVNGKTKWQIYPASKWKHLSATEVQSLLLRLNVSHEAAEKKALARYNYDHAFINATTLSEFENYLLNQTRDRAYINSILASLHQYTLQYFVHKIKMPDPGQWKKYEAGFGAYLQAQPIEASTIKRIIMNTNRLITFLHNKWPDEIRYAKLQPLSHTVLRDRVSPNRDRPKFISDVVFHDMCEKVDRRLVPVIKLAYFFGLRLAEVLALEVTDLLQDCLFLQRQLTGLSPRSTKLPKGGKTRDVPYWFCTPDEAYSLILALPTMHPDTVGHLFADEMSRLALPYKHHDFRRTFITNATRKYSHKDAQHAAGHSDSRTTDKYIQDDRQFNRAIFKPTLKQVL